MKIWYWVALASGPVAVGLWWLAGLSPATVEAVYSRGVYPLFTGTWSRLTSLVPLAMAPWLVAVLAVGAVAGFFVQPPLKALALVAAGLSLLVAWFVLGWGLNYQRLSWAQSHGLVARGGTIAQLEALAVKLAAEAGPQRARAYAAGSPDWTSKALGGAITRAYDRASVAEPLLAGAYGSPKAFPISDVLSWLGIAGIFIPHTAEPMVNTGPAHWQLPFTAAHEAAHLRGWAREDEANYLAFLVLKGDPDPAVAYSAWSSALLYVTSALGSAGPEGKQAWDRVLPNVAAEVRADWKQSFAYWDRFRGPVQEVSHAVNDLYLKSQGQRDGIQSYGRMVDLLMATLGPGETSSEPSAR